MKYLNNLSNKHFLLNPLAKQNQILGIQIKIGNFKNSDYNNTINISVPMIMHLLMYLTIVYIGGGCKTENYDNIIVHSLSHIIQS